MKYRTILIPAISVLALILFVWLFTRVVIYLLIAAIFSLIGQPLLKFFSKIKILNKHLPQALSALMTLIIMFGSIFLFFYLCVPLIVQESQFISTLNFQDVFSDILNQFPAVKKILLKFGTEQAVIDNIILQANALLNTDNLGSAFNQFASITGTIIGGTLAVLFITFFLLKDNTLANRTVLLITPSNYETEMRDILRTTKTMLTKYFVGLSIDVAIVTFLVSGLMYAFGVKNAIFIGIITGLLNIIPYVGPLISFLIACFFGITGCIENNMTAEIGDVLTKIFFILLTVNIVDGFLIQPYIYSSSVQAHPLEIFLVILMAASVGGILGMGIAIPTYTLLRIIAKEFLNNYKFFKKLTENIPE